MEDGETFYLRLKYTSDTDIHQHIKLKVKANIFPIYLMNNGNCILKNVKKSKCDKNSKEDVLLTDFIIIKKGLVNFVNLRLSNESITEFIKQ